MAGPGGAVVVVTSKSGTNQLRASPFEYLRNEKLDARNFFALAGGSKPSYKVNQFGASLGGPVLLPHYNGKSRTFFFTDYEGYREVFGSPLVVTVPTAAARNGNFQGVTANGIFDPLTTRANPAGGANLRTRFPGGHHSRKSIRLHRFRDGESLSAPADILPGEQLHDHSHKAKQRAACRCRVDRQLSPKDSLFFRYTVDWAAIEMPNTLQ